MKYSIIILFVISMVSLLSCKKEILKVTERFADGTIRGYYYIDQDSLKQGERILYHKSGKLFSKTNYHNNQRNDSVYFYYDNEDNSIKTIECKRDDALLYFKEFYENRNIRQEGFYTKEDKRIGVWKSYNKDGTLSFVKEYKIIKGEPYTNQLWIMHANGDTLNQGSNMKYSISSRRIKLGDSIRFLFQSDVAEHPGVSDFVVVMPKDYTQKNFNADFSNIEKEFYQPTRNIQRIYSLKYTNDYPSEKSKIDTTDYYKTVLFYLKPKRIGKDTIRGYFDEVCSVTKGVPNLWWRYADKEIEAMDVHKDSAKYTEIRTIYFDVPIEVYN